MEDTICAVSTAPGAGGIAVIRISGPEAIAICNTIFVPRTAGKGLLSQKAYTLRYGSIRRGEELIDEVLIALAISATTNPMAALAMEQLPKLKGCEAHITVIVSNVDRDIYRKLGLNLTCESNYATKKLYHK